jgi:hypothetical protein
MIPKKCDTPHDPKKACVQMVAPRDASGPRAGIDLVGHKNGSPEVLAGRTLHNHREALAMAGEDGRMGVPERRERYPASHNQTTRELTRQSQR